MFFWIKLQMFIYGKEITAMRKTMTHLSRKYTQLGQFQGEIENSSQPFPVRFEQKKQKQRRDKLTCQSNFWRCLSVPRPTYNGLCHTARSSDQRRMDGCPKGKWHIFKSHKPITDNRRKQSVIGVTQKETENFGASWLTSSLGKSVRICVRRSW